MTRVTKWKVYLLADHCYFSLHLSGVENRCFPGGDDDNEAVLELRFSWPGCMHCTNQPTNVFLSVVNLPFFLCEWAKWDLVERTLAAWHRLSAEADLQPGLTLPTVNGFMLLSFTLQHSLLGVIGNLVSTKWQFIGKSALFGFTSGPPISTDSTGCLRTFFLMKSVIKFLFFRWFYNTLWCSSILENVCDLFSWCFVVISSFLPFL